MATRPPLAELWVFEARPQRIQGLVLQADLVLLLRRLRDRGWGGS